MSAKNASATFVQRYAVVIGEQTVDPLEFLARVLVHVPERTHVPTRYLTRIVACILQGSVIAQMLAHLRTAPSPRRPPARLSIDSRTVSPGNLPRVEHGAGASGCPTINANEELVHIVGERATRTRRPKVELVVDSHVYTDSLIGHDRGIRRSMRE